MKKTLLILVLLYSVVGCKHCSVNKDTIFVNHAFEDSLELYFNAVVSNSDCKLEKPSVAEVLIIVDKGVDTTLSISFGWVHPPIPPAPSPEEYPDYVPPVEKGWFRSGKRLYCITYVNAKSFPDIINESILSNDYGVLYENAFYDSTDRIVAARASEKVYRLHGLDSLELLFRYIGPTEKGYIENAENHIIYGALHPSD